MLNNDEIQQFFNLPVKENVDIDANTIYGYASCSSSMPTWEYQVGGFLKLIGSYKTESKYLEMIAEKFIDDDEEYWHTFVFLEVEKGENDMYEPIGVIGSACINEELSRLLQSTGLYSNGKMKNPAYTMNDLVIVGKDTPSFEWEI